MEVKNKNDIRIEQKKRRIKEWCYNIKHIGAQINEKVEKMEKRDRTNDAQAAETNHVIIKKRKKERKIKLDIHF